MTEENKAEKEESTVDQSKLNGMLCAEFEERTTDELLELLPSNLHLARNENAPDHDRWRIYNSATNKYVEPGKATARELLIYTAARMEEERRKWTSA